METITILKETITTKDNIKFDVFKFNLNGKKVDLKFRQDSNDLKVIPTGITRVNVERLQEDKRAFYPKYYATFKGLAVNESPTLNTENISK